MTLKEWKSQGVLEIAGLAGGGEDVLTAAQLGLVKGTVIEVLRCRRDGGRLVRVRGDMLALSQGLCAIVKVREV